MVKVIGSYYREMLRAILKQRASQGLPMDAGFLASVWSEIIGESLAEVTRPVFYDAQAKRLTIATTTETWQRNLRAQSKRLLEILAELLPEPVTALTFTLGTPELFGGLAARSSEESAETLGSLPMAEAQLLEDIEDEELRAVMTRVRRRDRALDKGES